MTQNLVVPQGIPGHYPATAWHFGVLWGQECGLQAGTGRGCTARHSGTLPSHRSQDWKSSVLEGVLMAMSLDGVRRGFNKHIQGETTVAMRVGCQATSMMPHCSETTSGKGGLPSSPFCGLPGPLCEKLGAELEEPLA